jgi:hypothetical protein
MRLLGQSERWQGQDIERESTLREQETLSPSLSSALPLGRRRQDSDQKFEGIPSFGWLVLLC